MLYTEFRLMSTVNKTYAFCQKDIGMLHYFTKVQFTNLQIMCASVLVSLCVAVIKCYDESIMGERVYSSSKFEVQSTRAGKTGQSKLQAAAHNTSTARRE